MAQMSRETGIQALKIYFHIAKTFCIAYPVICQELSSFMHVMYGLMDIKIIKHYHNQ